MAHRNIEDKKQAREEREQRKQNFWAGYRISFGPNRSQRRDDQFGRTEKRNKVELSKAWRKPKVEV